MPRVSSAAVAAALAPDRRSSAPLYRQLYTKLRHQILTGAFGPGQQIPSSRMLAADLDISRNTALNAIEQLVAWLPRVTWRVKQRPERSLPTFCPTT